MKMLTFALKAASSSTPGLEVFETLLLAGEEEETLLLAGEEEETLLLAGEEEEETLLLLEDGVEETRPFSES
jgi:hypothetical protein